MVTGRIQLEEAAEQVLEIPLGENLLLQDHLKHRLSEIMVWVVGVLHDGDAFVELLAWADHPGVLGVNVRLRVI